MANLVSVVYKVGSLAKESVNTHGDDHNINFTLFAPTKIVKNQEKNRKPSKLIYMKHIYNNYLMKVQVVRQLGLHYILNKEMKNHFHKRINMYSLLNLETRLNIILLCIHLCSTIPQTRQMVSHQKIRVNDEIVRAHLWLSCCDFIAPAG